MNNVVYLDVSTLLEILDMHWYREYCFEPQMSSVSTLLEILGLVFSVLVGF